MQSAVAATARIDNIDAGEAIDVRLPITPERRVDMRLERFEVYSPDAEVWLHGKKGSVTRIEPSALQFFMGMPKAGGEERLLLIVDPARGNALSGFSFSRAGSFAVAGKIDALEAITLSEIEAPEGIETAGSCSTQSRAELISAAPINFQRPRAPAAPLVATRLARLAVDTDNEFMQQKFADNSAAANNWIAQLVATMNAQTFEPELDLSLTLTLVNLRPSSAPDPYTQNSGSSASQAELVEFGSIWQNNFAATPRVMAMLLSGKSPSPNSASGIAWLDSYCRTQSSGGSYSFNKIFKFTPAANTLPFDARLVGHEIGHNLGSNHTHCLDTSPAAGLQPVDQCFNTEPSCYTGPTVCPVAGSRTIMSYCNIGACSPNQNDFVFGPFVKNLLLGRVAANFPSCITPASAVTEVILRNGFE